MNDKQTLRSISLWLFFSVCDLGTPSPFMRRSPFTSTWSTGTLFSTWAPFLRTDTSRSSWNKCLEVCLCEREKDGETITLLSFVSEKKKPSVLRNWTGVFVCFRDRCLWPLGCWAVSLTAWSSSHFMIGFGHSFSPFSRKPVRVAAV